VVLGAVPILIQEQVKVNDIIEFKLGIVFDQLLVLDVVVYSVELEHQDVWWPAYPRLQYLLLALFLSLEAVNLRLSERLPCLIELALIDPELDGANFVNILVLNLRRAVQVNYRRYLNLAAEEVLPYRVLEGVQPVVHEHRLLVWINEALILQEVALRLIAFLVQRLVLLSHSEADEIVVLLSVVLVLVILGLQYVGLLAGIVIEKIDSLGRGSCSVDRAVAVDNAIAEIVPVTIGYEWICYLWIAVTAAPLLPLQYHWRCRQAWAHININQIGCILAGARRLVARELLDKLFTHHLPDHLLVLAQSILKPLQEVQEELSDIFLLVNGYLLTIVVYNALEYLGGIPVLLVGAEHAGKELLHVVHNVL